MCGNNLGGEEGGVGGLGTEGELKNLALSLRDHGLGDHWGGAESELRLRREKRVQLRLLLQQRVQLRLLRDERLRLRQPKSACDVLVFRLAYSCDRPRESTEKSSLSIEYGDYMALVESF